MMTYKDVATRLGVSERTVRELVKQGRIPRAKIMHSVRIDPADVAAFIEQAKRAG